MNSNSVNLMFLNKRLNDKDFICNPNKQNIFLTLKCNLHDHLDRSVHTLDKNNLVSLP